MLGKCLFGLIVGVLMLSGCSHHDSVKKNQTKVSSLMTSNSSSDAAKTDVSPLKAAGLVPSPTVLPKPSGTLAKPPTP